MINLLPPAAKKSITLEYWLRVITVWFVAITIAVVAGVIFLVPAYVLVHLQVKANQGYSEVASQKISDHEAVSKSLETTNLQAKAVIDGFQYEPMSDLVASIRAGEDDSVSVSEIKIARAKDGFGPVIITGSADSRQALASFRDRLLASDKVASVDLPISNLAKDKDIQFNLTVTLEKPS